MGTTPTWALRYPEVTDDVRPHEDIKTLADDTAAALTLLKGQVPIWSKRAERTTDGTLTNAGTNVELPYLRLDNIPIVTGKAIKIWTPPLILNSTVAGDLIQVLLRVNTAGVATVLSTPLTILAGRSYSAAGNQETKAFAFPYIPAVTGNLSVLMSYVRANGTGQVNIRALSTIPAQINIDAYLGTAPPNTGVPL